jgi:hypothetical protein
MMAVCGCFHVLPQVGLQSEEILGTGVTGKILKAKVTPALC